jgi:hypothetical protein
MSELLAWIEEYQTLLQWLGGVSLVMLVATPIIFPLIIIHLPRDYFVRHEREPAHQKRRHPVLWLVLTVLKNILGVTLILAGIAMLVLPGQGLLTILIGITLANGPGKYTLERWLVRKPTVSRALNRIRRAAKKPDLHIPEVPQTEGRAD